MEDNSGCYQTELEATFSPYSYQDKLLEAFLDCSGSRIATLEESKDSSFHPCLYQDGEKNASIYMLSYSNVGVFENRQSDQFEENSTYLCFSK